MTRAFGNDLSKTLEQVKGFAGENFRDDTKLLGADSEKPRRNF